MNEHPMTKEKGLNNGPLMNSILKLDNVHKIYRQNEEVIYVLRGIDFELSEPKAICITGRSGSGKSTLINLVSGLDQPTDGHIFIQGRNINELPDKELSRLRRDYIGIIFQFHHLLPEFTVLENVMLPQLARGRSYREALTRAEQLIEEVGLVARRNYRPQYLSGGEQQKVAVARAMANDPKLILADEPTGNLDPQNAAKIFDILLKLCYTYKKVCIVVTHSVEFLQEFDERYILENGKLNKL